MNQHALVSWWEQRRARWSAPGHFLPLAKGKPVLILWEDKGDEEVLAAWQTYLGEQGHPVRVFRYDKKSAEDGTWLQTKTMHEARGKLATFGKPHLVVNTLPSRGLPAMLLQSIHLNGVVVVGGGNEGSGSVFVWQGQPQDVAGAYLWITQLNTHDPISI